MSARLALEVLQGSAPDGPRLPAPRPGPLSGISSMLCGSRTGRPFSPRRRLPSTSCPSTSGVNSLEWFRMFAPEPSVPTRAPTARPFTLRSGRTQEVACDHGAETERPRQASAERDLKRCQGRQAVPRRSVYRYLERLAGENPVGVADDKRICADDPRKRP